MNGLLGSNGGYDFAIEIGSEGIGKNGDDVRGFSFTLDSSSRDLTLADFANVDFGVRVTSVGRDVDGNGTIDTSRNGSSKIHETSPSVDINDAPVAVDGSASVDEDGAVSGALVASDADNATLTYSVVAGPAHGTLSAFDAATGAYTYTPAENYFGADSFTFKANDGTLDSNVATISLTVAPVNDAPTTTPVVLAAIAEDSGARLITQAELLANASDVDGDSLTATDLAISAGSGALVDNLNGTWSYTPALNDNTAVAFAYNVRDGIAAPVASSATLDITPVNDAPVANADSNTGDPVVESGVNPGNTPFPGDPSAAGNVLTNDTDADAGDSKTVTTTGVFAGTYGSLSLAADGSWSYALDNADGDTDALAQDAPAQDVFNYTMRDTAGATASSTLTITVAGANDAPVVNAPPPATTNEDQSVAVNGMSVSDVDGDNLTVTLTAASTLTLASIAGLTFMGGSDGAADTTMTFSGAQADINAAIGSMTYAPTPNDSGIRGFSYSVSDGLAAPVTGDVTIDVTPDADAPTLIIGAPGGGPADPTPMRAGVGVHQYDMRNLYADLSLGTLVFQQGDPSIPIFPPIDPSARFTVTSGTVTYVASGSGFTYGPGNVPTGGTINGLEIKDPGDPLRPFLTLLNSGTTGDDAFAIPVADFLAAIADYAAMPVGANTAGLDAIFKTNVRYGMVGQDDGDHPGNHHNDIFVGGDLNDSIAGADGADTMFGGGGTDLLIGGADQGDINWGQGGADWFQLAGTVGAPENDFIADFSGVVGLELDIIDISANINVTWAMVQAGTSQVGDNTVIHIFDPSPTVFADLTITLLNFNAANLREADFVLFGQTNPLAATFNSGGGGGSTGTGNEDTPIALPPITAALNDLDGSETLVVKLSGFPPGATFSKGAAGAGMDADKWIISNAADIASLDDTPLTMTPPLNFNDSFTLGVEAMATDSATLSTGLSTNSKSTLASIPVTVNAVNDPASITGDSSGSVTEDGDTDADPLTSQVASGDLNSTDVDGVNDSWQVVMAPAMSTGGYATYTVTSLGVWTYTLNNLHPALATLDAGETQPDSFTVMTTDGTSQVVSITINGQNDAGGGGGGGGANQAPTAINDSYSVQEGSNLVPAHLVVNAANGVLGTALGQDFDPDGGPFPLTAELVSGPSHGALTLNLDGSFTYSPVPYYLSYADFTDVPGEFSFLYTSTAPDSFTYRAFDGTAYSNVATATITVTPPPRVHVNPYGYDMQGTANAATEPMAKLYDDLALGNPVFTQGLPGATPETPIPGTSGFSVTTSLGVTYQVSGTGLTYDPLTGAPDGGTITGPFRILNPDYIGLGPVPPLLLEMTSAGTGPEPAWQFSAAAFSAALGSYAATGARGGLDAIFQTVRYSMIGAGPVGHENDKMAGGPFDDYFSGAAGADTIFGGPGDDFITGWAGNFDVVTGGPGADFFQPGGHDGADSIADFSGIAGGEHDFIDLRGVTSLSIGTPLVQSFAHSFADVMAHTLQVGPDTVIDFSGQGGIDPLVITLQQYDMTALPLQAGDFLYYNNLPFAQSDSAATDENTVKLIDVLTNDTDADNDALSIVSVTQSSQGASVTIVGNQVQYDPTGSLLLDALPSGFPGIDSFSYTVTDGLGGFATGMVNVNVLGI